MLLKTRGIVLRTVKYAETSLIADLYTEHKGLQTYIISGVRSAKSKTSAGLLQVMSLTELVAYFREDRKMHRLKEIKPAHVYQRLPFEVRRSAVGLFMAELARKTIREAEENQPLFRLLYDTFVYLDETPESFFNLHLHFMLELSGHLGFHPGGDWSVDTPYFNLQAGGFEAAPAVAHHMDEALSAILYQLLRCPRQHCHQVVMTGAQRRQLLQLLITYYQLHMEHLPPIHAHTILQEVLE